MTRGRSTVVVAGFALAGIWAAIVSGIAGHWLMAGASLGVFAVAGITLKVPRGHYIEPAGDSRVRQGVGLWHNGARADCERWLSEMTTDALQAHATRTSALTRLMAEQLAVPPDQVDELMLGGLLHVLPFAYAEGAAACGDWPEAALERSESAIAATGHEDAARTVAECQERWDGEGAPGGLVGEASTLAGRILATACAFDLASTRSLDAGLAAIREGSGTRFDPVVAAELLYLFTEPWQLRQVA